MTFPRPHHGHDACADAAEKRVEARASEAGKRLKDNHRIVFSILLSDHRAVGVYDIAARSEAHGKRLQPVQIYRALETLMELGSVHRVESANAYVACHSNHACRRPQILICTACDRVSEMDSPKVQNALEQASLENGFVMTQQNIELRGLCPNCTDQPNP